MTAYTLYLGLIARDNAPVKPSTVRTILDDTARTFGGYTSQRTNGGYTTAAGFIVEEPSLRLEIVTDAPVATVRAWTERVRILANQESVLLTSHNLQSADFIGISAPIVAHEELTTDVVH